jgi:hypothetical protein
MQTQIPDETPTSSIWAGGLLAVSLVILQCFLPLNATDLDRASYASIFALAFAIPALSYKIVMNILRERKQGAKGQPRRYPKVPFLESSSFMIGVLSALVGIATAFYHIHQIAALIFSVCTAIGLIAYLLRSASR